MSRKFHRGCPNTQVWAQRQINGGSSGIGLALSMDMKTIMTKLSLFALLAFGLSACLPGDGSKDSPGYAYLISGATQCGNIGPGIRASEYSLRRDGQMMLFKSPRTPIESMLSMASVASINERAFCISTSTFTETQADWNHVDSFAVITDEIDFIESKSLAMQFPNVYCGVMAGSEHSCAARITVGDEATCLDSKDDRIKVLLSMFETADRIDGCVYGVEEPQEGYDGKYINILGMSTN